MRYILIGAAGFIGTNLSHKLAKNVDNIITLVDENSDYIEKSLRNKSNVNINICQLDESADYNMLLKEQDVVFHLVSTSVPATSNQCISKEILDNTEITLKILDACVKNKVKKVVFISSGGTVYGKVDNGIISENTPQNPICSYGTHKLISEKLVQLYYNIYGIEYRIIRLANPYGPYQRPDGKQGVIANFINNALHNRELCVYGDGSVVRDYIYIDDAIEGIISITNTHCADDIINLGSGRGTTVNEIIAILEKLLKRKLNVQYSTNRSVDVPVNILDISKYRSINQNCKMLDLEEGIRRTIEHYKNSIF